jgi:hypothetical protein
MTIFSFFSNDFPIGTFGIHNVSDSLDAATPLPNLLGTLREQNLIPSRSWGYLAGAVYRKPFTTLSAASLTLGGYDSTRMNPSAKLRLAGGQDEYRPFLLGIEAISTGDTSLLADPINEVLLTSQVPSIWLPLSACRAFEEAFDLVWNETRQLYLLDEAQVTSLQSRNPNITFTLSSGLPDSEDRLNVTLPYEAFNLNTTFPEDGTSHYWFPLQRAANDTQYTLGRTILQEIYMVADYEHGAMTLYEAVYPDSKVTSKIVTICPIGSTTCKSGHGSALAPGAIAGIAVGGAVVFVLTLVVLWYKCWRKPSGTESKSATSKGNRDSITTWVGGVEKAEMDATSPTTQASPRPHEMESYYSPPKPELDSGYTSPHAPTGSASASNPRDSRSVGVPGEVLEAGGSELRLEAGGSELRPEADGAEVHEMTAYQEQERLRAELPGSPGRVRHELYGSTSWPRRGGR